ncbi:MAG: sigma-70 family RNA polymerase sigma factor [Bacteroidales bacterium]|nr:sigma-70 family RNA polymerase sigma factor [Bacteroidales bacterium]
MYDRRLLWFSRLSDRQLVDMLLANDEEAVEYVFFYRCDNMFAHIINSIYHSQVKKEELITEFYMYLSEDDWRRLRQFEFKSALNTWLTIVAVRYFKGKTSDVRTKTLELNSQMEYNIEMASDNEDPFQELSKLELYEYIEQLPKPRERFALLGMLTGKSAEVIAKELGCTVMAVYNLTKKARQALQKMMKGNRK